MSKFKFVRAAAVAAGLALTGCADNTSRFYDGVDFFRGRPPEPASAATVDSPTTDEAVEPILNAPLPRPSPRKKRVECVLNDGKTILAFPAQCREIHGKVKTPPPRP